MPLFVYNQVEYNTDNHFLMLWMTSHRSSACVSLYFLLSLTSLHLFISLWSLLGNLFSEVLHFLFYALVICFVQCSVPFHTIWMRADVHLRLTVFTRSASIRRADPSRSWKQHYWSIWLVVFVRYLQSFNDTKILQNWFCVMTNVCAWITCPEVDQIVTGWNVCESIICELTFY